MNEPHAQTGFNADSRYETPSLYADPVLYDILHTPGTADEVAMLERLEARYAPNAPRVWLEPACGSGRCLRLAAKHSRTALGFDLEPAMIEYATERAARLGLADRSRYFVADMRSFADHIEAGSVGLTFNLINTVRHLMTDDAMHAHLTDTARVTNPKGVYIIGISLTEYGLEPPSEDIWTAQRGSCKLTQIVQYIPPTDPTGDRIEPVYSHLTVQRPRGEEHFPSSYELRAYDPREWQALLDASPWRVAAVTDAAGKEVQPSAPGYSVWVLRKRA